MLFCENPVFFLENRNTGFRNITRFFGSYKKNGLCFRFSSLTGLFDSISVCDDVIKFFTQDIVPIESENCVSIGSAVKIK